MSGQTKVMRAARAKTRESVFKLALQIMPTLPENPSRQRKQVALISMMEASYYQIDGGQVRGKTINARQARQMLRAARKLFIKEQRGGVGQHQRH